MGRRVACPAGTTLLDCCRNNQIPLASTCGGQGKCHSCKLRIEQGDVTLPTRNELKKLSLEELKRGWRLACQVKPAGNLVVNLPGGTDLSPTPAFKEDLLSGIAPDAERGRLRKGPGVAIDLGTTKIAGYLLNLADGTILGSHAMANLQSVYGDDVISRITYALKSSENSKRLQQTAISTMNGLIVELCSGAAVEAGDIVKLAVCGNTAMHHLALGLPVKQLASAPYLPAVKDAVEVKAGALGLEVSPATPLYFLPNIGGYVGGDHVAVLLAVDALKLKGAALVIDIGTNTEISLVQNGKITSVSCASGPAFEGGHIGHGMKAGPGAIDKINIRNSSVKYRTINGPRPVGICGSGILDAVAEMLKAGIIDGGGRMAKDHPLLRRNEGQIKMIIAAKGETAGDTDIVITQGDVRELQLAKAAIRTGIDVLLDSHSLAASDINKVIIAGTFGSYISVRSAVAIGMLPALPAGRFSQVGNAAGAGACMALLSAAERKKAQSMAQSVKYLELAERPDFMGLFVSALHIGKKL